MIKNDLTNKTFGRLTVLKESDTRSKQGYVQWVCRCECGNTIIVSSYSLTSGNTKSCGCLQKEIVTNRNMSRSRYSSVDRQTRLYKIWKGMHARTSYESQASYRDYGARGIKVCDDWADDYTKFRDWALDHGYDDNLTIDRVDVNDDYTPDNCKWSTRKEQNNNQRSNIQLTYNGETHTAAQWAEMIGVSKDCIYKRIQKGYEIERILKEFIERS